VASSKCVKCPRPLPKQIGKGRPAIYCSVGCRRAVAAESMRIQKRLERLEDLRSSIVYEGPGMFGELIWPDGCTTDKEHLLHVEKEISEKEERLRLLFVEE